MWRSRGGDSEFHRTIANVTRDWTNQCSIRLDFGYDQSTGTYRQWTTDDVQYQAEIRISFDQPGYWSLVGTDSTYESIVKPNEASMNFERFNQQLPDDFRGVILHEFGHALGFEHEHQHPTQGCDAEFRWDDDPGYQLTTDEYGQFIADGAGRRPGIYAVLGGPPNNWPTSEVNFNLKQLQSTDSHAFKFSDFDRKSIMKYLLSGLDVQEWQPKTLLQRGRESYPLTPGHRRRPAGISYPRPKG